MEVHGLILSYAQPIDLTTVAEGVESEKLLEVIIARRADLDQEPCAARRVCSSAIISFARIAATRSRIGSTACSSRSAA